MFGLHDFVKEATASVSNALIAIGTMALTGGATFAFLTATSTADLSTAPAASVEVSGQAEAGCSPYAFDADGSIYFKGGQSCSSDLEI